jgi:DNA-binding NtrC family response regulator
MILENIVTVGRQTEIQQLARQIGKEVFAADSIDEALDTCNRVEPELVIFDQLFTPTCVSEFISKITSATSIVAIGGDSDSDISKKFAEMEIEFIEGPKEHPRLQKIARNIANPQSERSTKKENRFFADDLAASASFVGKSSAALHTLKMIKLVANSQCNPIMIIGKTGTGKEVAAKAIHNARHREEEFVALNCAALTANLLESELFGHVKGSFTSADREKIGLLELAGTGTLFLDEISEMPLELQAKLLRVLQEKTFRKVGGTKEIRCEATIIASSNRNLKSEIQAKRFRADLYYRLDICPVALAPLNSPNRSEDIGLLAEYFIKTSTICPEKSNKITSMTKLALEALSEHDWPGNVRELRNVIDRAILLETTNKIGLSSIIIDTENTDQFADHVRADNIKGFSLVKAERELIARALHETKGQKTRAAELLGISRATLYAKVKQHSISNNSVITDSDGKMEVATSAESMAVA